MTFIYFMYFICAVSISYVWSSEKTLICLVAGALPRRPRFNPRPVRVGFEVYRYIVALEQAFSACFHFPSQYHFSIAPHS